MSLSPSSQLESSLRSALAGRRVAVLAVGNEMRADDGFGPAVAARLRAHYGGAVPGSGFLVPSSTSQEQATTNQEPGTRNQEPGFPPMVIDAGTAPENYTGAVRRHRPEVVLVLDAADFGGRPGELRLLAAAELVEGGPSTHAGGLGLLFDYLRAETGAEGLVLAVQAGSARLGGSMGPAVAAAVDVAAVALSAALPREAGGSARA